MSKPKILVAGEASYGATGFGSYTRELCSRLYDSGKYTVAEFSQFAETNSPKDSAKWRLYANMVGPNDKRMKQYASSQINAFGAWRFERVLIDFKPDIVISFKDPWMMEFQGTSPLRPYFHWIISPTVDSAPQKIDWLYWFKNADAVFTYSDFGYKTLLNGGNGTIPLIGPAYLGVDHNMFKPHNISQLRDKYKLDKDALILGTVMRNQPRKLYVDLLKIFTKLLDICAQNKRQDIADNLFLYIHTAYPDSGWNIPALLNEFNLGHKVLVTYICAACGDISVNFFSDVKKVCIKCNKLSAYMPGVASGVPVEKMPEIMGLFDLYIQVASCFHPDTKIYINNGWHNINNVRVGDKVYTHNNNWKSIINTQQRYYSGDILNIKCHSDYEELRLTPEHPLYGLFQNHNNKKYRTFREYLGRLRNKPTPKFIDAQDIKIGDMLAFNIDMSIIDVESIDFANYASKQSTITSNTIKSYKHKNVFNRYIEVDNNFCRFIGLFAADGHWGKNGSIKITSNTSENSNIELAINTMQRLCNSYSIRQYKGRSAVDIICNSIAHNNWLSVNFLKYQNKKLPDFCMYLPIDKQKAIIHGLFMGDGCYFAKRNTSIYCTTSQTLANQLKTLLRRCKINFNCNIRIKNGNRLPQYVFEVNGNVKNGEFNNTRHNTKNFYINDTHYLQIKDIKNEQYSGYVYNLEVEKDNSYLTHLGIAHNCEGLGIPIIEAAACQVPVAAPPYSAMEDLVRDMNGVALPIGCVFREHSLGADRVYPDIDKSADAIFNLIRLPKVFLEQRGVTARNAVEDKWNYDNNARIYMDYIDGLKLTDKWDSPIKAFNIPDDYPKNLNNQDFVEWLFTNVLHKPEDMYTFQAASMISALNIGFISEGRNKRPYSQNDAFNISKSKADNQIFWEKVRCGLITLKTEDYLEYAHIKDML